MFHCIKKYIDKIADYLDVRASKERGLYLKKDIEKDYSFLNIKNLQVIETFFITTEELNMLKELVMQNTYSYPFKKEKSVSEKATMFLMLLQLQNEDRKKYAAILDLQAGYDMVRGKPIIWLQEIKKDLCFIEKIDEIYTF